MVKRRSDDVGSQVVAKAPRNQTSWTKFPGIITRVYMKNFMCHAELDYRPTERLNFLHGANGSGKSAVLSAIVFGLGGHASTSNRGKSNKGLIRNGESSAKVEITLYNRGEDAYRPEVYGDSITVVRSVSASGGSGYQLKSHNKLVVQEKRVKEELNRILASFSIQVDNPIAILNQDAAKTFLFKCDPHKLYEFFMRATQLETLMDNYNRAAEEKAIAESLVKEKFKGLDDLEREKKMWEKKFGLLTRLEERRDKFEELKKELAWTNVAEEKKGIAHCDKVLEGIAEKIRGYDKEIAKEDDFQKNYTKQKAEIQAQIQSLAAESGEKEEEIREVQKEVRQCKLQKKELVDKRDGMERKLERKTLELSSIEQEIAKVKRIDEGEVKQRREARMANMERLEEEVKTKKATQNTTEQHNQNILNTIKELHHTVRSHENAVQRCKDGIKAKTGEINGYKRQGLNKLQMFGGEKVPRLVQEVEKAAAKFKRLPLGPLGHHVELAAGVGEAKAKLIDKELSQILNSFLVDNFEDKRQLEAIANRCGMGNLNIITSKFADHVYDVSQGRCSHPKFPSILDCLQVTNPTVLNTLIDQKNIETILLVDSDRDAQQMLKSVQTVPRNCKFAYTLQFNQYYPAPAYRSYAVTGRLQSRLQSSVEEVVDSLQTEIEELKAQAEQAQADVASSRQELASHNHDKAAGDKVIAQLRQEINRANTRLAQMRQEAEDDKSPDISALEEDRERVAEEVEEVSNKRDKVVAQVRDAQANVDAATRRVDEKKSEWQEGLDRKAPLLQQIEELDNDYSRIRDKKKYINDKKDKFRAKAEATEEDKANRTQRLEDKMAVALRFSKECPFPDDHHYRSRAVINKEAEMTEETIRRSEDTQDPKEVVLKKYQETQLRYAGLSQKVDELTQIIKHIDYQLKYRKKGFLQMRGTICRSTSHHFSFRLSTRGFFGKLVFDHKENTLQIMVNPNSANEDDQGGIRDIKTLSGGEKSYCTVSLVLSLWEDMYPPFRILDEFDVFMDSLNRRTSIDLILSYAKESRKFQYLFLTPLNLDHINDKDDVQVIRFDKNQG